MNDVSQRADARDQDEDPRSRRIFESLFPYLLVLPAIVVLALIFLYPLFQGGWLSLHSYNLNQPWKGIRWVGLGNYIDLFTDRDFYRYLGITFYWVFGSVLGELVLGCAAALVLNQAFWGRPFARAIILIPWAVPTVLAGIVFSTMFNSSGIVNELLFRIGLIEGYLPWLSSTTWAMPTLILAHVWKSFPFITIIILAGLQSIPRDLYEAADLDGAGPISKFYHVTLPGVRGVLVVAALLSTIFSLKGIDFQYIMTFGGPAKSTTTIAFEAYHRAFAEFNFGEASAMAIVVMLLAAVICFFYLRIHGAE